MDSPNWNQAPDPEVLRQEIGSRAKALCDLLARVPTIEALVQFWFHVFVANPETYAEETHKGQPGYFEYLTLLALKGPCSFGEAPGESIDLDALHDEIAAIFTLADVYRRRTFVAEASLEPGLAKAVADLVHFQALVRNPAYETHLSETLDGILGDQALSDWLVRTFGFSYDDARRLNRAAESWANDAIVDRARGAFALTQEYRAAARAWARDKRSSPGLDASIVRRLASLSPGKLKNALTRMRQSMVFDALSDSVSFSPADLADKAGVSEAVALSYIKARESRFGDVDDTFLFPSAHPQLQMKPFLKNEMRYLVTAGNWLEWGLRVFVEEVLDPSRRNAINKDQALWQRYERRRSSYLEVAAASVLGKVFRDARAEQNAIYSFDRGGTRVEGEVDGLFMWGGVLLTFEAKAAGLSIAAQMGDVRPLRDSLSRVFLKAGEQGDRLREFLKSGQRLTFTRRDGTRFELDAQDLSRHLSLVVTLEGVGPLTPVLHQLATLEVFQGRPAPWALTLFDLRVISELCATPSQFLHFEKQRVRIMSDPRHFAIGELDYWGHYLANGLPGVDAAKDVDWAMLTPATREIDDYYAWRDGVRKTSARRPAWYVGDACEQLVVKLDDADRGAHWEIAEALIELERGSRERIISELERYVALTRNDAACRGFAVRRSGATEDILAFVVTPQAEARMVDEYVERIRASGEVRPTDTRILVIGVEAREGWAVFETRHLHG